MQDHVGQRVAVGLRQFGNERVNMGLNIHLIAELGDAHETFPQRVGDERLFQRAQEQLQRPGDDVNVHLRNERLPLAAQQSLLHVFDFAFRPADAVNADFVHAAPFDFVDAMDDQGRDHGRRAGRVVGHRADESFARRCLHARHARHRHARLAVHVTRAAAFDTFQRRFAEFDAAQNNAAFKQQSEIDFFY